MEIPTIKELVQISPVPIQFMSALSTPGYNGLYIHPDSVYSGCKARIEIKSELKGEHKLAVLVHEISHALCAQKNCKCQSSPALREQHAYTYELKWLLKHKLKEALRSEMRHIKTLRFDVMPQYRMATEKIMKSKLWRRCLIYVGEL